MRGGETVSSEEVNMADSEALYRVLPCGCQGAWLSPQGVDGAPPGGNSMGRCVREDGIEPGTVAGLEELPAVWQNRNMVQGLTLTHALT